MAAPAKPPLNIGLMVPINNTTMERELLAWLPAGSTCTTLRIPRGKGLLTPEAMQPTRRRRLPWRRHSQSAISMSWSTAVRPQDSSPGPPAKRNLPRNSPRLPESRW